MRRDASTSPDWATTLDGVSRGLRAGLSLSAALAAVEAPPLLAAAHERHVLGTPLVVALDDARHNAADLDDPVPAVLALTVLAAAALHGGATAESLDRTAATVRERAALRHEAAGHAAAARLSARVLTAVPLAFAGFAVVTDERVRHVLLTTPLGWMCLVLGLGLNLVGRAWMNRVVASVGAS